MNPSCTVRGKTTLGQGGALTARFYFAIWNTQLVFFKCFRQLWDDLAFQLAAPDSFRVTRSQFGTSCLIRSSQCIVPYLSKNLC